MRILLTGANGLLGQKLVYLLREQQQVTLCATGRGASRINAHDGFEYRSLDVAEAQDVQAVVADFQPDCIINAAAMTNVDACELDPKAAIRANVDAVANLVAAAEWGGAHLVHVSTDFIFDGENGPYVETDEPNPLSHYARTKLAAEELVQRARCPWSIVRAILVYGVTDSMSRSNVVLWARKALHEGEPIRVVNDQWRTPTLAEDLAVGCWLVAKRKAEGIFHIGGAEMMSILELVERVAAYYQLTTDTITPVASESLNAPAMRPPKTGFDITKARNTLGFEPHSFEAGLQLVDQQLAALEQR